MGQSGDLVLPSRSSTMLQRCRRHRKRQTPPGLVAMTQQYQARETAVAVGVVAVGPCTCSCTSQTNGCKYSRYGRRR